MHRESVNFITAATVNSMDSRRAQETLKLLLFLLCLNILTDQKTAAVNIREKCMCVGEANSVSWRRIKDFTLFSAKPLCNKVQIIINIGKRSVCLAPNSPQGTRLRKCWKRINFNEKKKKSCLPSGKVKKRQKKPKTP